MNILIITAHPSNLGFTHLIAQTFKEASEKKGHVVEVLDLYRTEIKQSYLSFEKHPNENSIPGQLEMQEKILWADQMVFIHPLWWGGVPAIMKNWLDVNLSSGFAYKYEKNGPKGLLKGKTARVFITGGGALWMYLGLGMPFYIIWRVITLWFCGISMKSFTYFGGKYTHVAGTPNKRLEKVKRIAEKS